MIKNTIIIVNKNKTTIRCVGRYPNCKFVKFNLTDNRSWLHSFINFFQSQTVQSVRRVPSTTGASEKCDYRNNLPEQAEGSFRSQFVNIYTDVPWREKKTEMIDVVRFGNTHLWVSRMQLSCVIVALCTKSHNLNLENIKPKILCFL